MRKSLRDCFSVVSVLLSVGVTFFLLACSRQQENLSSQIIPQGHSETLNLLYWQAPTILNPHLSTGFKDSEASRITLEPLASYDNQGNLIPFLAAEIPSRDNGGISPDGKSVTWKLKEGIKWSDGTPFMADDVVFTYQFVTNPKVGSTSANNYVSIETVKAIDKNTVKVVFKKSNPAWDLPFVGGGGMILPRHLYKNYNGENARQAPENLIPIGTGPYKVVEFKPGNVVVYEVNSHFREVDKLGFKKIKLKGGGDATSAARAVLQTGDVDYAYNLQVEVNILNQLAAGGAGKIKSIFGGTSERILINLTDPNKATIEGEKSSLKFPHPFFQSKQVREAFSLAIDRDTIAQQLYGVTGKAISNFLIAPLQYNSPNTSYEFNLEKASQLLDKEGWKDSNNNGIRDKNGIEMKIVFQTSVNPLRQKTQEVIKQGLQKIGVGVELKNVDASIFFSSDPSNNDTVEHFYSDLEMFTTGNTNPDPSTYMKTYMCDTIPQKSNNWSGDNYSRYCNPAYDRLWQQAVQELDTKKRQKIFIAMNDMLVNDFIVIPLIHRADVVGISTSIQGFESTPWDFNTWNIKDWKTYEVDS
ncbi:peptide ABC transporter substrate-binding protein [Cyanobacterium sp. uoEpiScrs1]|uniref:peptide ABC transporter substrate-binding protein n=1 Tax=Cyanobacterium sp. uoEpiScrs1 TaxID=2976343 RepID=UPI002269B41E|nr:peptide ABC transporter substrate-binding protein [Cyanobacterium sp. uoEpiScrs1]